MKDLFKMEKEMINNFNAMFAQLQQACARSFDELPDSNKFKNIGFEHKPNGAHFNRIGWFGGVDFALAHPNLLREIEKDARHICDNFKYVIFSGMGGSSLCIKLLVETFGCHSTKIFTLDGTDPKAIKVILDCIANEAGSLKQALQKTLIVPISKSATTKETNDHMDYFKALLQSPEIKLDLKKHIWFMTDPGSPWAEALPKQGFKVMHIQLNEGTDIGGRFSGPSTRIFLLPMAMLGFELEQILNEALKASKFNNPADDQFLDLGAWMYKNATCGLDKMTFLMPKELYWISPWAEQLIEESLGKAGKGVSLFYGEKYDDRSIFKSVKNNDRIFVHFNLNDKPAAFEETAHWLKREGYPLLNLSLGKSIERQELLKTICIVMMGLQRAAMSVGYLWDICFVDQPAVEGYKIATKEVMKPLEEKGLPIQMPQGAKASGAGVTIYYQPLLDLGLISQDECAKISSMDAPIAYAEILNIISKDKQFQAKELGFYGYMAHEIKESLESIRYELFNKLLKLPTKLGEGPGKNHSYQQNLEGGRNIFFSTYILALKHAQPPIIAYSDNLLKAQAIGTYNSMAKNKRKVVLITLDNEADKKTLASFFDKALKYVIDKNR